MNERISGVFSIMWFNTSRSFHVCGDDSPWLISTVRVKRSFCSALRTLCSSCGEACSTTLRCISFSTIILYVCPSTSVGNDALMVFMSICSVGCESIYACQAAWSCSSVKAVSLFAVAVGCPAVGAELLAAEADGLMEKVAPVDTFFSVRLPAEGPGGGGGSGVVG